MAFQQEQFRPLLKTIERAHKQRRTLTHKEAARKIGLPERYAHPIGDLCQLIDASAAWAGLPMLAAKYVGSGLKPSAFGDSAVQRRYFPAIKARFENYDYSDQDFKKVQTAFEAFAGIGHRAAWRKVYQEFGEEGALIRLCGGSLMFDSINDLGSDIPEVRPLTIQSFIRDAAVRKAVIQRASGRCEYCNREGFLRDDGTRYLEAHHIIALADDGTDRLSNVIALCPDDHREAHFGAGREKMERKMIAIVRDKIGLD